MELLFVLFALVVGAMATAATLAVCDRAAARLSRHYLKSVRPQLQQFFFEKEMV